MTKEKIKIVANGLKWNHLGFSKIFEKLDDMLYLNYSLMLLNLHVNPHFKYIIVLFIFKKLSNL